MPKIPFRDRAIARKRARARENLVISPAPSTQMNGLVKYSTVPDDGIAGCTKLCMRKCQNLTNIDTQSNIECCAEL